MMNDWLSRSSDIAAWLAAPGNNHHYTPEKQGDRQGIGRNKIDCAVAQAWGKETQMGGETGTSELSAEDQTVTLILSSV